MIKFFRTKVFTLKNLSLFLIMVAIILTIIWAWVDKLSFEPWTVIPQLILVLLGLLGNKKANEFNIELFKDFQRQLDNVSVELRKLNPKSASSQLLSLEKSIENSTLPGKYINRLLAELYYLRGQCHSDLGLNNEVYPNFIIAFNYQKQDLKMIERACTSYYFTGENKAALKIADEILKVRPQNARAWAIKVAMDSSINLMTLPVPIRVSKTFKSILATAYAKQGRHNEINELLREELESIDIPAKIEYSDLPYWMLVSTVLYNNELKELPNDMLSRKDDSTGKSERIQNCLLLSKSILAFVEGSQLFRENKYYQQSYFIYNHAAYLVNNDREGVLNMYGRFKQESKSNANFIVHLIPSLSQIKEYDKVIEICEEHRDSQYTYNQILAFTYFLKGDYVKSCEYFSIYIKEIKEVNENTANNLIVAINVLFRYKHADTRMIFNNQLRNKVYANEESKNIIEAVCLHFNFTEEEAISIQELLTIEPESFDTFSETLKDNVCKTLSSIGQYHKSNEYISRYIDENRESQGLYLYIRNLHNLRTNHTKLLKLLERWRKHFKPLDEFFKYEINILNELNMYAQLEEVSEFALSQFPNDPLYTTILIQALDRQDDKRQKLIQKLDKKLLKIQFYWEHAFLIGAVCFKNGLYQLGLDLIFPYAKNNSDNATIRQSYFGLVTIQANKYPQNKYERVELNTTARVTYDSKPKIIHVDPDTIESNIIAKAILKKQIGETIELRDGISKRTTIIINEILDKYSGLLAEITEEVANSFKISGYQMRTITWKSGDIEDLHQTFIKEFGADGELRKLTVEDAFNSYYKGKISFTELVRKVDHHKIFEIYENVTGNNSKGFIIPPLAIFKQQDIHGINEFVVDLSTLPILSKWKEIPQHNNYKFMVSQHLRDFIRDKIEEVNLLDDSPLTLSISLSNVQPIPYPPNYKTTFLAHLNEMLDWITKNCIVGFAPEKLDILLRNPELIERNDWYFKYLIDTTFLANHSNRALITDDLIYYKLFAHLAKPITLEYFIKTKEPKEASNFMKWFLKNNYIGLTLSISDLQQSFDESPTLDASSMFQKCIKNIPFNWHKNESLIYEIIDLAKYIYTHALNEDYKLRIIESLFVEALREYPIKASSSKTFQQKIHEAFHLLGSAELKILMTLTNALKILSYK